MRSPLTGLLAGFLGALLLLAAAAATGVVDGGDDAPPTTVAAALAAPAEVPIAPASPVGPLPAPGRRAARGPGSIDTVALYRAVNQGVVTVRTRFGHARAGLLDSPDEQAVGSGFVIDRDGFILTNDHVVTEGADTGQALTAADEVFVDFADRRSATARIVGQDPNADLALIKVDPAGLDLRPLPLGDSSGVVVGQPVATLGSPFDRSGSLSVGIVSAVERDISSLVGRFQINDAIQTDAAINRGNSGGPLLDAQGRVIGVNAQIATTSGDGSGVGFAIPVDLVRRTLPRLRRGGVVDYGYLGVTTQDVTPQLAERLGLPVREGALILDVSPDTPAARAGVRGGDHDVDVFGRPVKAGGDVIVAVNGRPIHRSDELVAVVSASSAGDRLTLSLRRGADRLDVTVTLGSRHDAPGVP